MPSLSRRNVRNDPQISGPSPFPTFSPIRSRSALPPWHSCPPPPFPIEVDDNHGRASNFELRHCLDYPTLKYLRIVPSGGIQLAAVQLHLRPFHDRPGIAPSTDADYIPLYRLVGKMGCKIGG
jgi:hypothetical protein